MDDILDQPLIEQEKSIVKYSTLGQRFLALVIDWIILSPISFGLTYLNPGFLDGSVILIFVTLVQVGYKPFMEYTYGATWGKMAMKLRVKNLEFGQASLGEILLRNIFNIVPQLVTLFFSLALYDDFGLDAMFDVASGRQYILVINSAFGLLSIADAIVLVTDKKKRSIHDRVGGTVVVSEA